MRVAQDRVGTVAGQLGLQGGAGAQPVLLLLALRAVFDVGKRKCFGCGFTEKEGISQ